MKKDKWLVHSSGYLCKLLRDRPGKYVIEIPDLPMNTLIFDRLPQKATIKTLKNFKLYNYKII